MTNEQKVLLESYLNSTEDSAEYPSIAPSFNDLAKPCPEIRPIPLSYTPNPQSQSWEAFWQTGLPTVINSICTIFGWALVAERDKDGNIVNLHPVRTNSRGLGNDDIESGLAHLSRYMAKNAPVLHEESYIAEQKLMAAAEAAKVEQQAYPKVDDPLALANATLNAAPEVKCDDIPDISGTSI